MKYDPVMCMMVDDSVKVKDAEFQMYGPEFHHPIIKANSKEEAIKKAKKIYGWGGKVEAVKVSDNKTIDKAIRNCDDLKSDKEKALEEYKEAKADYEKVAANAKSLAEFKELSNTPEFRKFMEKKNVCMKLGCRI